MVYPRGAALEAGSRPYPQIFDLLETNTLAYFAPDIRAEKNVFHNLDTQVVNGHEACSCLPGYTGRPPLCRPECVINAECPTHLACIQQKCKDPCIGACGIRAYCQVPIPLKPFLLLPRILQTNKLECWSLANLLNVVYCEDLAYWAH